MYSHYHTSLKISQHVGVFFSERASERASEQLRHPYEIDYSDYSITKFVEQSHFDNHVVIRFVKKFPVFYGTRSLLPQLLESATEHFQDGDLHFTYSRSIPFILFICGCVFSFEI